MSEVSSIIAANTIFYEAFASGDIRAMGSIWVKKAQPTCIHPGWAPLVGHKQVMKSWENILGNGNKPPIKCANARVFQNGGGAYVICEEHLHINILVATNIFVKEVNVWKIVHHQASPTLTLDQVAPINKTLQ